MLMRLRILLACTLLVIDGRRAKKDSEALQSGREETVSGPKTKALLPLLMAFKPRASDAFAMGPVAPRGKGSRLALSHADLNQKPWAHPTARAGLAPTMAAPENDFFAPDPEGLPEGFPLQPARTADESNDAKDGDAATPPLPSAGDPEILQAANTFLYTGSGFYSPPREDLLADDFVFRGPVVGPLNKQDYLDTLASFGVYTAYPDISPNAFGFTVDPENPLRVWFLVRNTGTNTGPFGLGFGLNLPPSGNTARGLVETFSITFDEARKVKLLTVGYLADRFDEKSNTGGYGAALGLLTAALGGGPAGALASNKYVQRIANAFTPKGGPRTVSDEEDVPAWWPFKERGAEGA